MIDYFSFEWNNDEKIQNAFEAHTSSTRGESTTILGTDIRINSLPALNSIVNTFLHSQSHKGQCQQSIHTKWRLYHSFNYSNCDTLGMSITKGCERNHSSTETINPSILISVVILSDASWCCIIVITCHPLVSQHSGFTISRSRM